MREKPILFSSDMVRAILEGRKTQTRRVIKPHNPVRAKLDGYTQGYGLFFSETRDHTADNWYIKDYTVSPCWISDRNYIKLYSPYKPGDMLWAREAWAPMYANMESTEVVGYLYRSDDGQNLEFYDRRFPGGQEWTWEGRWRPSIHMPREAARLFLRVTDVNVERLQSITPKDAYSEGTGSLFFEEIAYGGKEYHCGVDDEYGVAREQFAFLWESTIKKGDLPLYGWDANPWVWRIQFEKIEKGGAR